MKKENVSVRLPPLVARELDEIVSQGFGSRSEAVRYCIHEYRLRARIERERTSEREALL